MILLVLVLLIFFAAVRRPGIPFNSTAEDKVLLPGGLIGVAVWSWVFGSFFYLAFTVVGLWAEAQTTLVRLITAPQ